MNMQAQIFQQRPPFVRFEERQGSRDEAASLEAGYPIHRTVVMACITPHGSKDCFEKPADDWIAQIRDKAAKGEYNPEWARYFAEQFKEWKLGNELPREGTPVKTWQLATRDQAARLIEMGYRVVEDVAQIPDSGLAQIGLDGRYIRDLARTWVQEGKDKGVTALALANANAEIARLKEQNEALATRFAALEASIEQQGRPQKGGRKHAEA